MGALLFSPGEVSSVPFVLLLGLLITPASAQIHFTVETEALDFRHQKGGTGKRYIVETMGSGVVLFDFDGDGDLDVFLPNGRPLDEPGSGGRPGHRLFSNDGRGSFTDVTSGSGLEYTEYGVGCAVGDIDNDGDSDLFLTNFGRNRLYRNEGKGRFVDVTDSAGVGDESWGASAAFADLDGDGFLDLYVANYLDFTLEKHKECTLGRGIPAYCSPDAYPGVTDRLYRNAGDGTFEDVTARSGIENSSGKGLGVIAADLDGDGQPDIYVANDGVANRLYRNRSAWRFEDDTLLSGVGFSGDGMAQAGMGVAAGDLDGDGQPELFVTNLSSETNVLYRGEGEGLFIDDTEAMGLAAPSLAYTGFGTCFGDLDLDGDLDIFVANGHIIDNVREFYDIYTYEQPDQVFRNDGGTFTEVTASAHTASPRAGRGAAAGDIDGDGDLDLVVTNCGAEPYVYRNDGSAGGGWLIVHLVGTRSNRDGVGARVEITAAGKTQTRIVLGGGSYLSASDPRPHFGLGLATKIERVVVRWPGGSVQTLENQGANRVLRITEPGEGKPPSPRP